MSSTPDLSAGGTVFEPYWDDNPTWVGSHLYADLSTAQVLTADAYVLEMYPLQSEDDDGPGTLKWTPVKYGWELTDGGEPTPVSIGTRTVRARLAPASPGALSLPQQLALASEFRVPLPQGSAGGYAEIVVKLDTLGGRWAVTNGALLGLQTWVEGEGWRYVSDVGRATAYRHKLEDALLLAHEVAELEAVCYQAGAPASLEDTSPTASVASAGATCAEDVLTVAEQLFRAAAGHQVYDRQLCMDVLSVVIAALSPHDRASYVARLEVFAGENGDRLERLYRAYGPGSAIAGHGRYELVAQPVSLVLCERLDEAPLWLAGTWDGKLPDVLLADVSLAWGRKPHPQA